MRAAMEAPGIGTISDASATESGERDHVAFFYADEQELLDSVGDFIGGGLECGAAAIVICTNQHRRELERRLQARGIDLAAIVRSSQYVLLDATATLESLTADDWPQAERFADRIDALFNAAQSRHPEVRAFEEVASLLWQQGRHDAAICLEELWNELARSRSVSLLCGYPMSALGNGRHTEPFLHICTEHSQVIPAEHCSTLTTPNERLLIRQVQRRTAALDQEMRYRRHLEHLLRKSVEMHGESDRRKHTFLSTLAHELRNPLAPIRNAVELIRMAETDRATVGAARTMIERQLTHLTRLVDDLMDASRITSGRLELHKDRIDLATVTAQAVELNQPLLESKQLQLRIEKPNEPLCVEADVSRLTQVISSLLSNAARHSGSGAQIVIRMAREGDQAAITVTDTGIGIPENMLPHIFDMFMRSEKAEGDTSEGLGIGLSLVKHLVELHGGTVEASSEGPGKGSRFTVRLALQQQPATTNPVKTTAGGRLPQSPSRILIADDNIDAARSLALILRLEGHEVRTAHDGMEALEIAEMFRPHVILLDISMPRLDGYGAVQLIRKRPWAHSTLLIALTGWEGEEHERRARAAGFDRHLVKPVNPLVVEALLAEHRQTDPAVPTVPPQGRLEPNLRTGGSPAEPH